MGSVWHTVIYAISISARVPPLPSSGDTNEMTRLRPRLREQQHCHALSTIRLIDNTHPWFLPRRSYSPHCIFEKVLRPPRRSARVKMSPYVISIVLKWRTSTFTGYACFNRALGLTQPLVPSLGVRFCHTYIAPGVCCDLR